ncbi:MAG: DUF1893 domain-containing protein [Clostridia bacterium]|nr:DUF1893 domain-containing protein [Clostridia bacterium]
MNNQNEAKAKALLAEGVHTLVLCGGESVLTDTRRGVKPLLALLDAATNVTGYAAADRVVGKAAAFLYLRLGVASVYALVMSRPAYDLLTAHGVSASAAALVPAIRNRAGDGFCPMETAVWALTDPTEAEKAIRTTLAALTTPKM